jgi:hypothetical protein
VPLRSKFLCDLVIPRVQDPRQRSSGEQRGRAVSGNGRLRLTLELTFPLSTPETALPAIPIDSVPYLSVVGGSANQHLVLVEMPAIFDRTFLARSCSNACEFALPLPFRLVSVLLLSSVTSLVTLPAPLDCSDPQ